MNDQRHPFPFYNGAYWIDNSLLSTWRECPREHEYENLEKRKAVFAKAALNYGKAMHVALAGLVLSCGNEYTKADLVKLNALLATHFERFPQPLDDHRQLGLAQETLKRYVKMYEIEPWTILQANGFPMVERLVWFPGFMECNGVPINVYGLLDLVVTKYGEVWIIDHKTTSMLGTMFDFEMQTTWQMKGYAWLFKQAFGRMPMGYIVDAIRSLAPSEKIAGNGATLDKWWTDQFRRLPFFVNEAQLAEWEDNTKQVIEEILWQHGRGFYPMNDKSCVTKYGRCQFYDVCTLPQAQRLVALNSNNFEDNTWTEQTLGGKL